MGYVVVGTICLVVGYVFGMAVMADDLLGPAPATRFDSRNRQPMVEPIPLSSSNHTMTRGGRVR